jgi:molybdopterin synthase sulfur carrier subunit
MKLVYFAWVREKIGTGGEELAVPDEIDTVSDLVEWLRRRGPGYAAAFADPKTVRVAVNQEYAPMDAALGADDEIAFFPPVTGG